MDWFSALEIAKNLKSLENPMQVPSHIKERDNDEQTQ
jgi:hypothetical protein